MAEEQPSPEGSKAPQPARRGIQETVSLEEARAESEFLDRLALLSLLAVLPQATLWLAFKFIYPLFDVRFLLLRIIPLYLAAIVAAAISSRSSTAVFDGVPWTEIVASSAAAGLLILAIGLSSRTNSAADLLPPTALTSHHACEKILKLPSSLAGDARGMLT